jgi:RES domain-containing protein
MGNKLEKITLWRLDRDRWVQNDSCLSRQGASDYSARWNKQGEKVVYTAANISLAFLEIFVHLALDRRSSSPQNPSNTQVESSRRIIQLYLDDLEYETIEPDRLPDNWREASAYPQLQELGSEWWQAGKTAVLKVPSAIVPNEFNYVINPDHRDVNNRLFLQKPVSNVSQIGFVSTKVLTEHFTFDARYIQILSQMIKTGE